MFKRCVWFILLLAGLAIAQPSSYLVGPENFESATFPPTGWTTQDYAGANYWYRPSGNEVAQIDGNSTMAENDWLMTPSFDGTAAADSIILNYWYQITHWTGNTGQAFVAISVDNGVTWPETVAVYPAASGSEIATVQIRIDNLTTPLSGTTQIAFVYNIYNGINMMVDSVWVGVFVSEPAPPTFDHATYYHATYPYTYTSFPETVYIDDVSGVSPSTAEICYDVDRGGGFSGSYTCVSLTADAIDGQGRGTYIGDIPAQPGWSQIKYFFQATDTYVPPSTGTSDTFNLVVEGNYYAYDNTDPYPEAPDNTFRDITTVGTDIGISGDDSYTSVSLPFVFRFYGQDYSTIWVCSNGWLVFGTDPGTSDLSNDPIPTGSGINGFVAPLWDDLNLGDAGSAAYTYTSGDTFIIEWYQDREYGGSVYYNFEVMLINPTATSDPGGNGQIIVKYETMDTAGLGDATLGIENADGTIGVEYLCDGTYGTSGWIVDGAAPVNPGPSAIKYTTTMPPAGIVRGHVTLSGESDYSGVQVGAIDGATFTTTTASDGYYEMTVTAGTYDIYAYNGYYWETDTSYGNTIAADETLTIDFTLNRLPMATIYQNDFEADDGGFTPSPSTGGWEWGEPTVGPSAAHSGTNVWGTVLDGNYQNDADYRLETASFDFSSFEPPILLTYWQWYEIEGFYSTPWDGGNIKISTDGGSSWNVITPDGGYPASGIIASALSGEDGYSGHGTTWTQAQFDLSAYAGLSDVMVRWHFGSDGSGPYPGWYIDDVAIDAHLTTYGVIRGSVILSGESDYSGVTVQATGPMTSSDVTISDGSYSMFVLPGTYTVIASKEPAWIPETTSVTIADGETLDVNFILNRKALGYVMGYVDLTDTPGADAGILCQLLGTDYDTLSDAAGGYFFEAIPVGTYAVEASYGGYGTATSRLFTVAIDETTYVDTIYLQPEPLYEDFEADDGGYVPDPDTVGWEWGVPTYGPAGAHSGTQCWGTDLDDDYLNDADWKLSYDLSSYSSLITEVDFWHYYDMESYGVGASYDGGNVSISTDGGTSWIIVYPDGGYDDNDIVGLSGEPGYTGTTSDWTYAKIDLSAYTGSITNIRFRLGTDGSVDDPGWYIDDVTFPILPQPEGCVEGYVYDAETYATISGATVSCNGVSTTTDADGHFILCGVEAGYYQVNGIMYGYAPNYVMSVIAQNDTAGPVYIPLHKFVIDPTVEEGGLYGGLAYGTDDSATFTICNPNDEPMTIGIGIAPDGSEGGLFRSVNPDDASRFIGQKLGQIDIDNLGSYLEKARMSANDNPTRGRHSEVTDFSTKAIGAIVDSFDLSPESSLPWGFGCIGFNNVQSYWVSSIGGSAGEIVRNMKYNADGTFSGTYFPNTWAGAWGGDMTYDGRYIWQVNVGGDNDLYQWDPYTGAVVGTISDPTGYWDYISQRGVGYDAALDIFYIGGWNDNLIYEIKGQSWDNPGEIIRAWSDPFGGLAGISFDPARRTVWCTESGTDNTIWEFDPATSTISNVYTFTSLGDYALAGCEIDANGLLWFVSMNQLKAYAIEIPGGATPVGVAIVPPTVTIPANACTTITLVSSGLGAPGIYDFDIVITYDNDTLLYYPAEVIISKDIRLGWNLISVPFDADPNNVYTQLSDDISPFYNEPGHSNIYTWDPTRGMWVIPDEFARGVGYYLLAWTDHSSIGIIGTPYYDDFTMTLPYYGGSAYPGWNLVGNPVNTRIDWDNIVADPLFSGIYPTYYDNKGGSYSPGFPAGLGRYIDPFQGFFVFVQPGETGVLPVRNNSIFPVLARSASTKSDALPEFIFRVGVIVDGEEDRWNYIGALSTATDGFDSRWDALTPPPGMGYTDRLSFVNNDALLSRDIRYVMSDGDVKTWQVRVDNASHGENVTIAWDMDHIPDNIDTAQGINQIYEGYSFQLYDPVADEYIDMRTTDHYSFTYGWSSRTLYVIVSATFLNAEDKTPTRFALMQNVPNPFNSSTEISFTLPADENVSLEILDINGRVIRNVISANMTSGRHTVVWDGKDNKGQNVSSGVYFYRITAGDFNETRKMMLIK